MIISNLRIDCYFSVTWNILPQEFAQLDVSLFEDIEDPFTKKVTQVALKFGAKSEDSATDKKGYLIKFTIS
jgi:hypothetical protein